MRELEATLAAIDAFTIAGAAKTDRLVTIRKTRDEPPTRGFSVQVRKPAKLLSMNRFSKQFLSNISEQDIAAHGDDATALICPHRSTNTRARLQSIRIEPHLPAGQRPVWRRIVGKSGIDALIRSYHDCLSEQLLSEGDLGAVVDNFCRLLAIGCGVPVQEQAGAIRASQLETIKQFVKRHLDDPSMTPAIVAQEARISVRQLHRIFEPTGTSFAQFILSQRLDACLASLILASNNGRSIAEIAYASSSTLHAVVAA
jgi:AraC-like DNA-binding protein